MERKEVPEVSEIIAFALQKQNKNEFSKEANNFARTLGLPKSNVYHWDPPRGRAEKSNMFANLCTEIHSWRRWGRVGAIAIFCHGFPTRLQVGLDTDNVGDLADVCAYSCERDLRVILYTCSSADNEERDLMGEGPAMDGGLCDELRDALQARGFLPHVYGHKNSGHTTRNPWLAEFDRTDEGVGGHYIVTPRGPDWKRWRKAMRGRYRFLFPWVPFSKGWEK